MGKLIKLKSRKALGITIISIIINFAVIIYITIRINSSTLDPVMQGLFWVTSLYVVRQIFLKPVISEKLAILAKNASEGKGIKESIIELIPQEKPKEEE